jgi:hypothetical protein
MANLYTSTDVLITSRVIAVIPGYDTLKVVNRLLDGSFHVQTIGTGGRVVNISLVADETSKDTIDIAESNCAPVKVTAGTKYYTGVIKEAPKWDRPSPDVYRTSLILLVYEEGVA